MIWIALALLIACSGGVSASETALFGLSRRGLVEFGKSGSYISRQVHRLMLRPRSVLLTVLIANTAINISIFAVSFVAFLRFRDTYPSLVAVGGATTLLAVVVFGEIVPKAVALSRPRRFAPAAGALIAALQTVLRPVQWLLAGLLVNPLVRLLAPQTTGPEAVTAEELRLLVERCAAEGVIDTRENDMLQAVVALAEMSVRAVMTPRVDLVPVAHNQDAAAVLEAAAAAAEPTVLVYGDHIDDIRGLVRRRDALLNPGTKVRELLRPVHYVPEQAHLVQLVRAFNAARVREAVVVDEFGGTVGFVSTEDVVQRIVGALPAAGQVPRMPATEQLDDDTYRLRGDLSARVWADQFGVREIDPHVDTVAGLVLSKLGRMPREGDTVPIRNLTLRVERMRNRRIEAVIVRREK